MKYKETKFMARIGKIARLPRDIRAQLNSRLQDGHEGKTIVTWLNSLPQVKRLLAKNFDGHPVTESNLSDWRQGGYEEWLAHQDMLVQAQELAVNRRELEAAAPGRSLTDHLSDAVSFRFGAILAAQGLEFDDAARQQLRILGRLCQAVVKLRRSEQNAARLKIESERWDLARQQIVEDKAEAVKQKQRDALTAPFWGELRKGERYDKYGTSPAIKFALDIINEVETCEDPAHFQSEVLARVSLPEVCRASDEYVKSPPARAPEMQAAMDTYTDMMNFLAQDRKARAKQDRAKQPPAKPRRGARKPIQRPPAKPAPAPEPGSEDGGLKMEDGNPAPPSSILGSTELAEVQTPSSPSSAAAPAPPDPSNPQSAIRNPQSGPPPSPIVSNRS
jgi:hypothetical protein